MQAKTCISRSGSKQNTFLRQRSLIFHHLLPTQLGKKKLKRSNRSLLSRRNKRKLPVQNQNGRVRKKQKKPRRKSDALYVSFKKAIVSSPARTGSPIFTGIDF